MVEKLLNFNQAKEFLNTSKTTLYNLITAKEVPAVKVGGQWRFRKERLIAWLDSREVSKKKTSKR